MCPHFISKTDCNISNRQFDFGLHQPNINPTLHEVQTDLYQFSQKWLIIHNTIQNIKYR